MILLKSAAASAATKNGIESSVEKVVMLMMKWTEEKKLLKYLMSDENIFKEWETLRIYNTQQQKSKRKHSLHYVFMTLFRLLMEKKKKIPP